VFSRKIRRFVGTAAVVACCGAVGFVAAATPRFFSSDGESGSSRGNPRIALSDLADARDPATPAANGSTDVEPAGTPASTPMEAVESFLAAEIRADYAESYRLLSAPDRAEVGSRSEWEVAHGQLPIVTGVTLGDATSDGTRAEVDAEVTFEPALDETRGLVPSRAQGVWVAVAEDGGWRVAHSERRLLPQYPDGNGAVTAAETWAQVRTGCRAGDEYDGGLLGATGPVKALCGASGPVEAGAVSNLEPGVGVEPFLAAFGPEVLSWARVVPLANPVPVVVVLAPVADRWVVVGALELPPGGSS
jgi:hypothetical protein